MKTRLLLVAVGIAAVFTASRKDDSHLKISVVRMASGGIQPQTAVVGDDMDSLLAKYVKD